jgi:replicative DNA helicase
MTELPADSSLERRVLARMTSDPEAFAEGARRLQLGFFTVQEHRRAFLALRDGGKALAESVSCLGLPTAVGGETTFDEDVDELVDLAARRALIVASESVTEAVRDGGDIREQLDRLEQHVIRISRGLHGGRLADVVEDALAPLPF